MARANKRIGRRHMFVPDAQVKPGVNTDHLAAAGNYAVEKKPDVIVVAGDWWDMPSLSSYEQPGSKYFHDKNYRNDVEAGNAAMSRFMAPISEEINRRRRNHRERWNPRLVFTLGNHEHRITRAVHNDPKLDGALSLSHLSLSQWGFEVHDFLHVVEIDGVLYSHYFINPRSLTGSVLSGTMENRLSKLGASFTMGHQQQRLAGSIYNARGQCLRGLVAGAFYSHEEEYQGPQGQNYWRGIIIKNEVHDGDYDMCEVSLEYLVRRYL